MIDIRLVLRGMESEELAGKFAIFNNVTVLRERTKQGVTNHKHGILHIPRGKLLSTDFQVNLFMNIVSMKKKIQQDLVHNQIWHSPRGLPPHISVIKDEWSRIEWWEL